MLEVECAPPKHHFSRSHRRKAKMPVDFAAYLLSSSPPGFEFYSLKEQLQMDGSGGRRTSPTRSIITKSVSPDRDDSTSLGIDPQDELSHRLSEFSLMGRELSAQNNSFGIRGRTQSDGSLLKRRRPDGKKRVCFADDYGRSLVQVRIMTEPSDHPPRLRPEILSSLTQGASAGVTRVPPLVLNFTQPASDYLAFREKLESNCVSLENVILKDYNLLGTIKVKNIAFEKSVTVRCTFDSWESTVDVEASYCPTSSGPFDTFSFEISVPPNMDVRKKVQFCVRYMANGSDQYWDNNNGANYEVVSADWKEIEEREAQNTIFSVDYHSTDWVQYSAWKHVDTSTPYY